MYGSLEIEVILITLTEDSDGPSIGCATVSCVVLSAETYRVVAAFDVAFLYFEVTFANGRQCFFGEDSSIFFATPFRTELGVVVFEGYFVGILGFPSIVPDSNGVLFLDYFRNFAFFKDDVFAYFILSNFLDNLDSLI